MKDYGLFKVEVANQMASAANEKQVKYSCRKISRRTDIYFHPLSQLIIIIIIILIILVLAILLIICG